MPIVENIWEIYNKNIIQPKTARHRRANMLIIKKRLKKPHAGWRNTMKKLYGITIAMLTPFNEDGTVDYALMAQHTDMLIKKKKKASTAYTLAVQLARC